jgi:phage terminase small subunit
MGLRGPIAKDSQGAPSYGHTKAKPQALITTAPPTVPLTAPDHLGDAGRDAWDAAVESAEWLGRPADRLLLTLWGDLWDERSVLRDSIRQHGRVARGSRGQEVECAHSIRLGKVEAEIRALAKDIAVWPTNMLRFGVTAQSLKPKEPNVLEALQQARESRRLA